jgi:hypothetical protein
MLRAAIFALYFSTCTSLFVVLASVLQKGIGATPLESAVYTIAYPIALMMTASRVSKLTSVSLHARVLIGTALSLVSMAGIALAAHLAPASLGLVSLAAPMALAGAGLGFIVPSMMQIALAYSEQQDAGAAAGALHSLQQLSSAIGIPVASIVFYQANFGSTDAHVRALAYGEGLLNVSLLFLAIFIAMGAFAATLSKLPKD